MPNRDMTGPKGNGPQDGLGRGKCFNLKKHLKKNKEKEEETEEKEEETEEEFGIGRGGKPRHLGRGRGLGRKD